MNCAEAGRDDEEPDAPVLSSLAGRADGRTGKRQNEWGGSEKGSRHSFQPADILFCADDVADASIELYCIHAERTESTHPVLRCRQSPSCLMYHIRMAYCRRLCVHQSIMSTSYLGRMRYAGCCSQKGYSHCCTIFPSAAARTMFPLLQRDPKIHQPMRKCWLGWAEGLRNAWDDMIRSRGPNVGQGLACIFNWPLARPGGIEGG